MRGTIGLTIGLILLVSAFVSANNTSDYPDYIWHEEFNGAIDEYNHSTNCYTQDGKLYNCSYIFGDGLIPIPSAEIWAIATEFYMPAGSYKTIYWEAHSDGNFFNRNEGGVIELKSAIGANIDYIHYTWSDYPNTAYWLINNDPTPDTVYETCTDYASNLNHILGNISFGSNSNAGWYGHDIDELGLRMQTEYYVESIRIWQGVCADEPRDRPYAFPQYPEEGDILSSVTQIEYYMTDYDDATADCDLYIDGVFEQSDIAVAYMNNTIVFSALGTGLHNYSINCTDGNTVQYSDTVSFTVAPPALATGYVASYNEADIAPATISVIAQFFIVIGGFVTAFVVVMGIDYMFKIGKK